MNEWQKRRFTTQVLKALFNTVCGKRIGIWVFAFKKDIVQRHPRIPAISVCRQLLAERAKLAIYDPKVSAAQIPRRSPACTE